MFHKFDYAAPRSLDDLLALLDEFKADAKPLAGGTDLLVDARAGLHAFRLAVDTKRVPGAQAIAFDRREGLAIGMAATLDDLVRDPAVAKHYPYLAAAALHVGSHQIRCRATVVGNLCTASPCTDMGRALLAADARVEIAARGRKPRQLPLGEFIVGVKRTALAPGEVVTRVLVPADMAGAIAEHAKLKRIRGHDLAVASVTLLRRARSGDAARSGGRRDGQLRIVVGACAITPVLVELPDTTPLEKIVAAVDRAIKPIDDIRATADYRRHMVKTYVRRLHAKLAKTSKGGGR